MSDEGGPWDNPLDVAEHVAVVTMTDTLIFLDASGRRVWMAGWKGPWPPPERLSLMVGGQSGYVAIFEEGEAPAEYVAAARELGTIAETHYRLRNASTLPVAAKPDEHWFRGAEYVPEDEDA